MAWKQRTPRPCRADPGVLEIVSASGFDVPEDSLSSSDFQQIGALVAGGEDRIARQHGLSRQHAAVVVELADLGGREA